MYLIKKDGFEFSNILSGNYIIDEKPVILKKTQMSNGNIKVIYADYSSLTISIKFGQLDGATIKEYSNKFVDGLYEYWDANTRTYKSANFIVTKGEKAMISSNNGERYEDFDIVLEKSSEV